MLNVIIIMTIGIGIGFIFHKKLSFIKTAEKLTTYAIWLLLFLLGISVGANELIVKNIGKLGAQAFIISFASILGSVLLSYFLYILLFKDEK
ncbi:MAG: LysO family transporter [bacterium]|nr:LysO family transporter [bacterium]